MKAAKVIVGILSIFVVMPIWLYVVYSILSLLPVDRLVWFLFWVYVPAILLVGTINQLIEALK